MFLLSSSMKQTKYTQGQDCIYIKGMLALIQLTSIAPHSHNIQPIVLVLCLSCLSFFCSAIISLFSSTLSYDSNETIQPSVLLHPALQHASFFMPLIPGILMPCRQPFQYQEEIGKQGHLKENVRIIWLSCQNKNMTETKIHCSLWDPFETTLLQKLSFILRFLSPLSKTRNPHKFLGKRSIWEVVILQDVVPRAGTLADSCWEAAQSGEALLARAQ